jgi:hypothetical protein
MTAPRYARLAGKLFVREESATWAAPPTLETRAEAIAAVAAAIARHARRRRAARWITGAVGAVAVLGGVAGAARLESRRTATIVALSAARSAPVQITAHPVGGVGSVVLSGSQAPLAEDRSVAQGSRVVTPPDGRATLAFSTGTSVVVGEGSDVTLGGDGETQLLRLNAGWIDLHVAKLTSGQRFLVETPDSEVEVRGTRFRVSVSLRDASCGNGTATRVSVTEGLVVVRHASVESSVIAGERWPQGCATNAGAISSLGARSSGDTASFALAASPVASTLADQNNLFGEGLAQKRRGDVRQALASFERFLTEYPSSALAESAAAERMRLLRGTASSLAVGAAQRYLATYPNGFACAEAEAIIARSP